MSTRPRTCSLASVIEDGQLAAVIGRNAKTFRQRAEVTLNEVSIAARNRGLKWTESRVADFERGEVSPNLNTLLAVCAAMNDAGCTEATLPALVDYGGAPIRINESLALFDEEIRGLLRGDRLGEPHEREPLTEDELATSFSPIRRLWERKIVHSLEVDLANLVRVTKASGATEDRVRKALNISSAFLAALSSALWGTTFSAERDRRAGEGASAQRRGQITRLMQTELDQEIESLGGPRQHSRRGR